MDNSSKAHTKFAETEACLPVPCVVSGMDGKILSANEAFRRQFCPRAEAPRSLEEVLGEASWDRLLTTFREAQAKPGESRVVVLPAGKTPGTPGTPGFEARVWALEQSDEESPALAALFWQRASTEENLGDGIPRQDLLERIVTGNPLVIWSIDPAGNFTLSEGHGLQSLGLQPGEVVGKNVFEIYAEYPQLLEQIRRALAGERVQTRLETQDKWFESDISPLYGEDGKIEGVSGISRDVTREEQAERELWESRNRLDMAMAASGDGLWDWNLAEDSLSVNDSFLQLLGYAREEFWLRGWDFFQGATAPEDRTELFGMIQGHLAGTEDFDAEVRLKCANGRWLWSRLRGKVMERDEADGSATRLVGILSDISRQKLAQEKIEQARQTADHANRAKSEFIASLSHEIRTPITSIIGYGELLEEDLQDAALRAYATGITGAARNLTMTLEDIIDLSRVEAGRLTIRQEPVELGELAQDIAGIFQVMAREKQITLTSRINPDLPKSLLTDSKRIRQIIYNLLNNAVKFTQSGEINLELDCRPAGPDAPEAWDVMVRVHDTGPGIDPLEADVIFEPFQQGAAGKKTRNGGTGLGLAISRKLAQAMGGSLQMTSRPGEGSTFSLWLRDLKLAPEEAAAEIEHARKPPVTSERGKVESADDIQWPTDPGRRRELCYALQDDFRPRWETLREFWDVQAIGRWAADLGRIARKTACPSLGRYAADVQDNVAEFDVRQLRDNLKIFQEILQKNDEIAADPERESAP